MGGGQSGADVDGYKGWHCRIPGVPGQRILAHSHSLLWAEHSGVFCTIMYSVAKCMGHSGLAGGKGHPTFVFSFSLKVKGEMENLKEKKK